MVTLEDDHKKSSTLTKCERTVISAENTQRTASGRNRPPPINAAAPLFLRHLAEMGEVPFGDQPAAKPDMPPAVRYSKVMPTDPAEVAAAKSLQQWLSNFSGVFLAVDGIAGNKTSAAFRPVTGTVILPAIREQHRNEIS
jgi:hypothetical protein